MTHGGCRPSRVEACSKKFISYLNPPGEVVDIPYEPGKPICGYFVRAPFPGERLPVLIYIGGLDSIKDEMWFMQAHGCLQRGISVLMIDGPGQGGTLRRHKIYPGTIARCRSANASTGWTARRRRCRAYRGVWLQHGRLLRRARRLLRASAGGCDLARRDLVGARHVGHQGDDFGLAMHIRWVFGAKSMREAMRR